MSSELVFILCVGFILQHELDAIRQAEWRFFFAPFPISEENAYRMFTGLHLPLFAFILWNVEQEWFQVSFDVFAIIHLGLHVALRNHPLVNFSNAFSMTRIIGAAVFGGLHLAIT